MKCKDCQYCSQRGGYQYFFCDRDNSLIEPNDYYGGKKMDCTMSKIEDKEFMEDYVIYNIVRKR
jgi:hypothetical protein